MHSGQNVALAMLACAFANEHTPALLQQATATTVDRRGRAEYAQGKIRIRHKGEVVPAVVLQPPSPKAKKPLYTVRLENKQIIRVGQEQVVSI